MLTPIPIPLCAWLTLLAQAVPNRSALTFLELLIGAMITDRGFVTETLLAITPRRKWPTYFKWLEGTLLHGLDRLASGAGRCRKAAPSLTLGPPPCRSKPKRRVAATFRSSGIG